MKSLKYFEGGAEQPGPQSTNLSFLGVCIKPTGFKTSYAPPTRDNCLGRLRRGFPLPPWNGKKSTVNPSRGWVCLRVSSCLSAQARGGRGCSRERRGSAGRRSVMAASVLCARMVTAAVRQLSGCQGGSSHASLNAAAKVSERAAVPGGEGRVSCKRHTLPRGAPKGIGCLLASPRLLALQRKSTHGGQLRLRPFFPTSSSPLRVSGRYAALFQHLSGGWKEELIQMKAERAGRNGVGDPAKDSSNSEFQFEG